jgi:murein L,D-transpeptidase YcbB/YkuD
MFALKRTAVAVLATLTTVPAAAQAPMEIVVNIPAGRLDVYQGAQRVRSFPVSVGTPRHATPTLQANIRSMTWNPAWTPPDADWARNEKPKGPGWGNPMGRVKMHLMADYYVHGIPAAEERHLGHPASHGCVRMRNRDAMELAQMVLRADGAPVSDATVQALARNPQATRELALSGRVHVRIEYRLAEVQGDSVTLHPDVYGVAKGAYEARVRDELAAAGIDPTAVLAQVTTTRGPAMALRVSRDTAASIPETVPTSSAVVALNEPAFSPRR